MVASVRAKSGLLVPLLPATPKASAVSAQRVLALEAAIEADPYDIAAWDGRLREAVQAGKPVPIFERAVGQFPSAGRIWTAYADWWEVHDLAQAESVYHRCLQQVPSLDLWTAYLTFCKRHLPLDEVLRAYQRAVDLLGTDVRAGLLWTEYIAILKHAYNLLLKKDNPEAEVSGRLLAEDANPIEAARRTMKPILRKKVAEGKPIEVTDEEFVKVGEEFKVDIACLRQAFQRAVGTAHSSLDKLWIGYEQFEKSLGNPQLAQKILGEHTPRYAKGKTTYKELQALCSGLDHFALAVPLRPKNMAQQMKLLDKWRKVLQHEGTNPMRLGRQELQSRVSLLYQQAAMSCAFHAEIWHDFAAWLDIGGQREEATQCLQRAVERFLPHDITLRLLLAHRHELAEVPASEASLRAADDEYRRLLGDVPKPCPLALINNLAYIRRQRGPHEFRDAFLEAADSSPHCTWEVYAFAALTEYHVYGSIEAATRVFRLGLDRYGEREPSLLAAYVNFLVGANDLRGARAELSRGVLGRLQAGVRDKLANRVDPQVKDTLSFFWQKWARLERYFGDADAVRRAATFRDAEYRNLQRDMEVDEESIAETPVSLGLSMTITEVEEGYRFQHLVPQTSRLSRALDAHHAANNGTGAVAGPAAAAVPVVLTPPSQPTGLTDQVMADATEEHRRLASAAPAAGFSMHIVRPDVSKMLAFRPALDVIGRKPSEAPAKPKSDPTAGNGIAAHDDDHSLPAMVPKCLQDLLAVLPARPLKGAKPDVDYLLTVLQIVSIPPIPVKELEHFRYDSLHLQQEDDGDLHRRRSVKEEWDIHGGNGFFSSKPTIYRERLQAKRQKVLEEQHHQAKTETLQG